MKTLFKFLCVIALVSLARVPAGAQEWGVSNYARVPYHITTKTTTTPTSSSVTLYSLIITCTNAGTAWTISVQNKENTPKVLYSGTLTVGTTIIALPVGARMASGIDIVTGGTTAGVVDVWPIYK